VNRALLIPAVAALLSGLPVAAQTALAAEQAVIRDIRGPLPPKAEPPFSGTVLLVLGGGLCLAVAARIGKVKKPAVVATTRQSPEMADLDELLEAYGRGELGAGSLFKQLAAVARIQMGQQVNGAMTSKELLAAAAETVPPELIGVAAELLSLCDRVRYGGHRPEPAAVAAACAAVRKMVDFQPGTAP